MLRVYRLILRKMNKLLEHCKEVSTEEEQIIGVLQRSKYRLHYNTNESRFFKYVMQYVECMNFCIAVLNAICDEYNCATWLYYVIV